MNQFFQTLFPELQQFLTDGSVTENRQIFGLSFYQIQNLMGLTITAAPLGGPDKIAELDEDFIFTQRESSKRCNILQISATHIVAAMGQSTDLICLDLLGRPPNEPLLTHFVSKRLLDEAVQVTRLQFVGDDLQVYFPQSNAKRDCVDTLSLDALDTIDVAVLRKMTTYQDSFKHSRALIACEASCQFDHFEVLAKTYQSISSFFKSLSQLDVNNISQVVAVTQQLYNALGWYLATLSARIAFRSCRKSYRFWADQEADDDLKQIRFTIMMMQVLQDCVGKQLRLDASTQVRTALMAAAQGDGQTEPVLFKFATRYECGSCLIAACARLNFGFVNQYMKVFKQASKVMYVFGYTEVPLDKLDDNRLATVVLGVKQCYMTPLQVMLSQEYQKGFTHELERNSATVRLMIDTWGGRSDEEGRPALMYATVFGWRKMKEELMFERELENYEGKNTEQQYFDYIKLELERGGDPVAW